jgi:hypothetical protein
VSDAVPSVEGGDGDGWYVFGVVSAVDADPNALAGVQGLEDGAPVVLIAHGDLAAIATRVPLSEFGEEPLLERLHDPEWLERRVRAHDAVLAAARERATLVPFRFGTIFRNEDHVRAMLAERRDLADALARVRGKVELGVKAFLDAPPDEGSEETPTGGAGRSYLERKQQLRQRADERAARMQSLAQESHERLLAAAADGRANPLQPAEVATEAGQMFLNGAYLVPLEREREFSDAVAELTERFRADGATYVVTGPWPPYNFADSSE